MNTAAESVEKEMPLAPVAAPPPAAAEVAPTTAAPLLLAWVLPQLLLLAMNWGDARFLAQSASTTQLAALQSYALAWLVTFLAGTAWLGWLAQRRQPPGTATLAAVVLASVGLLIFYVHQESRFWPEIVAPWMLHRGSVWLRQEMLLLVPCYAAAWTMLSFQISPLWRLRFGVAGLFALAILPLATMAYADPVAGSAVMAVFGLAATAGGFFLLRKLDRWWREAADPASLRAAAATLAVVLPLLGLLLNAAMEFPASFQAPGVYLTLGLNAVALCWPAPPSAEGRRRLWLARCATVPFTAYFFVVFLPVLPFWLPGVLFLGCGLLILAPAALANFHFSLIAAGWREHCATKRSTGTALLALGAMGLLPVGLVGFCLAEKANLQAALHAIAYPELRAAALPQIDPAQLRRTLAVGAAAETRRGSDFFAGSGLPFVDDLRRRLVLGGLTIPAKLRADLAAAFLPQDAPAKPPAARRLVEPPQGAYIDRREVATTALPGAPGWEQTKIRLHLHMPGSREGEWVAQMSLPPDAFVTDHALVIDGQRVPSRLTDRNTALFVYERITRAELPRDPGLIIYTGPESVEARVFPVPAQGGRETDFTITHRAGAAHRIVLAGQPLADAVPGATASANVLVPTANGAALFPSREALAAQAFVRAPARLVLADGTIARTASAPGQLWWAGPRVGRVEGKLPLRAPHDPLWPAPLLGRIVLAEHLRDSETHLEQRPQLEWVSARPFPREILALSRTLAADFAETTDETPRPVAVLRYGGVVRAVAPEAAVVWFDEAAKTGLPEIYDRAQKRFVPLPSETVDGTQVQASVQAMLLSRERDLHPERFRENSRRLWKAAREARTLTPQTAFMVVENLAQWAILEKKEKEREDSPDELTSPASVPEPATWALLVAGGLALAGYQRVKRRKEEGGRRKWERVGRL